MLFSSGKWESDGGGGGEFGEGWTKGEIGAQDRANQATKLKGGNDDEKRKRSGGIAWWRATTDGRVSKY